jgi:class 3 adenylate cyclase
MPAPSQPPQPPGDTTRRVKQHTHDRLRTIRHELRTPLGQIIGYAELLQEEAEDLGQESFKADLDRIRSAARRMLDLLDDLFAIETSPRPAAAALPTPDTEAAEPVAASGDGQILLVDDEEANRDLLARRLERHGYRVTVASRGDEALAQLDSREFDLMLLDIVMPGLDGLEVLRRLRKRFTRIQLPVIMTTAMAGSEDVVRALRLGASDYVTKPIDLQALLARVQTQLSLRRATQEVEHLVEQLELRNAFLRRTFGRYLSDEVVASLLDTPEALHLGGARSTVTVLMADLRGFSVVSDRLEPEEVVRLLNNFLGTMAEVIHRNHGTIDEFIGDAILALFGAPIRRDDDARRAVVCALEMQLAMAEVNAWNQAHDLPPVEMGIGIHTSEVVVGNIGSRQRMKYAVVGRAVNHAARIESCSLGGQILISEPTRQAVGDGLRIDGTLELDAKGVSRPLLLHAVGGISGDREVQLPRPEHVVVPVTREVPLHCTLLLGKQHSGQMYQGHLVALGEDEARIRITTQLPPLTNLRLTLLDSSRRQVLGELYAKVTGAGEEGTLEIALTSVPPEVAAFLATLR